MTLQIWRTNLVINGCDGFGGLNLPPDAIVTTDRDLLEHGRIGRGWPSDLRDRERLVVIHLGFSQKSNEMLSGIIAEIVLARRTYYGAAAATWLLISEDPMLSPRYALNGRTKEWIAKWKHVNFCEDGKLRNNLRKARKASDPSDPTADVGTAEWLEDLQEDQIAEAFAR